MKNISSNQLSFIIKPALFLLCLLPFVLMVTGAVNNNLGTNPVETLTHETGLWALRFLLLALVITPLRRITKINRVIKFRRLLGLFAFFYACLHFVTYIWLDQFFDWVEILVDIPKRPFITIGFVSFLLLLSLALTSTNAMQKRLKKKWRTLHKLVYVIPILVVIHFIWSLKADYSEPFFYALVFFLLMFVRFFYYQKNISKKTSKV